MQQAIYKPTKCYNTIEGKMNKIVSSDKPSEVGEKERVRKIVIPLLTLLLVVAITVGLFFFYKQYPGSLEELKRYGYLGSFLISLIGNASVLLPGIVLPILSGLGIVLYPVNGLVAPIVVGLAGGAGAAIGEIVGYIAGYSGRGIVENKKLYERLVGWVRRWGTVAIFIFALVPLFFDLVGLAAGVLRFPLWKFILVCWLGRSLLYVVFVVLASLGWEAVLPYFG
jgi:membrane protein DedA with SNARE-associated domain